MDKIYALNEIQAIVNPILQQYGVSCAYLFGSYARGEATGQSDIDLRIDGGKIKSMFGLEPLAHFEIRIQAYGTGERWRWLQQRLH